MRGYGNERIQPRTSIAMDRAVMGAIRNGNVCVLHRCAGQWGHDNRELRNGEQRQPKEARDSLQDNMASFLSVLSLVMAIFLFETSCFLALILIYGRPGCRLSNYYRAHPMPMTSLEHQ